MRLTYYFVFGVSSYINSLSETYLCCCFVLPVCYTTLWIPSGKLMCPCIYVVCLSGVLSWFIGKVFYHTLVENWGSCRVYINILVGLSYGERLDVFLRSIPLVSHFLVPKILWIGFVVLCLLATKISCPYFWISLVLHFCSLFNPTWCCLF